MKTLSRGVKEAVRVEDRNEDIKSVEVDIDDENNTDSDMEDEAGSLMVNGGDENIKK